MEHDAQSSRLYKENWDDAVQASKADAAEIAELKEAYALLFKAHAAERERGDTLHRLLTEASDETRHPDYDWNQCFGIEVSAALMAMGPNEKVSG